MGRVHRRRRHPAFLAPGARRAAPRRLRGSARSRAPRGDEPFAPLLESADAPLSRMARSARAPRARRRHPSRPERHPMRILHTMLRVGNMKRSAVLELTYNYGVERYDLGAAFGHVAIGVPDVAAACDRVRKSGGKVTREPGPVKGGTSVIAFVEDPDGYKIEFIQSA